MKSAKGHHEEDEEEDEEFGTKRDASQSNNNKDAKNNDKTNAMRSKHSVTEQRRRSKINERYQILRDLIPHSEQKRDTASFLFEVIEYVQYLQEKVQKYEGSYQGWSPEPTKLIPWASIPAYVQGDGVLVHPLDRPVSDKESAECPTTSDALNQNEELMIEGGTINFSSAYSQGLLNALTQALQSSGVDLSQATISVQIDLGKRANRGLTSGLSVVKDHEKPQSGSNQQVGHFREVNNGEDADQARKKLKI